jgi:hypothetical protein
MSRLPSGGQATHPLSLISLLEIKHPLTLNPVAHFHCRSRVFVVMQLYSKYDFLKFRQV